MAEDAAGTWDAAVDALTTLDRRQAHVIVARLAEAVRVATHPGTTHPLTLRRVTALAVRDAVALYLLNGGTPDHLGYVVRLLDAGPDGRPAAGALTDRAAVARTLIDAVSRAVPDPDRVADCHRLAAALDQPLAPDHADSVRNIARSLGLNLTDTHGDGDGDGRPEPVDYSRRNPDAGAWADGDT